MSMDKNSAKFSEYGAFIGANVSLETILTWEHLPPPMRRALTRAIPPEVRARMTLEQSLRDYQNPMLYEWIAALTANDDWVFHHDPEGLTKPSDFGIGMLDLVGDNFRELPTTILGINLHLPFPLPQGRSYGQNKHMRSASGAAYAAREPDAPPMVCAAVYIYVDEHMKVESAFVIVEGAFPKPFKELNLHKMMVDQPFDEKLINRAAHIAGKRVYISGNDRAKAAAYRRMTRECIEGALMECLEAFRAHGI